MHLKADKICMKMCTKTSKYGIKIQNIHLFVIKNNLNVNAVAI